nr:vascular cell proliferation inhibitor {internal fragment} [cattle, hearts, aortas, Peptide Partial, 14 aa] [Bos taurus]
AVVHYPCHWSQCHW